MKNRVRAAGATALALGTGIALALAAPLGASAHVGLDTNTAEAGSFTTLTFKVPNESDTATTTTITLALPTDTPFASVRYIPVAGWDTQLVTTTLPAPVKIGETTITEAVTSVIWTATGDGIAEGALQLFPLSVGPVPDVGSLTLPVDQGYSDGTTISWSETGENAEHPAPVLYVNDAPAASHHDDGDGDGDGSATDHGDAEAAPTTTEPDVLARVLGGGGLVLGAAALVIAVVVRRARTSGD